MKNAYLGLTNSASGSVDSGGGRRLPGNDFVGDDFSIINLVNRKHLISHRYLKPGEYQQASNDFASPGLEEIIMVPYLGNSDKVDEPQPDISISIDRGGTFCDVIATVEGREDIIFKLLSEDPNNYPDAPTEAIRRVLCMVEGREIPIGEKLDASRLGMPKE